MSDGGKGSTQRPTDKAAYDKGYERIFKKRENLPIDPTMGTWPASPNCAHPFCNCEEKCEDVRGC